jgi:hypothetical protein
MKPAINIQPYLKATILVLSIWIVALLMNTMLVLCWSGALKESEVLIDTAGFIIWLSAEFSSPGLFVLWYACMRYLKAKELFRILLAAAFTGALISSVTIIFLLLKEGGWGILMLTASPVVMALLSVLLHKPFIIQSQKNIHHRHV